MLRRAKLLIRLPSRLLVRPCGGRIEDRTRRVFVVDEVYSPAYSPPVGPDGFAPPSFACRAKALLLDDGPVSAKRYLNDRSMTVSASRSECPDLNRGSVLPKHVSYQAGRHSDIGAALFIIANE